ncbi:MAG: glycosyltransferase family 2 protein, partial [Actinomycetota bacterium]
RQLGYLGVGGHFADYIDPMLSVIIVNHESGEHLRRCLAALPEALGETSAQVVVVDNASQGDDLDSLEADNPSIKMIRNPENRGYGRACNQGVTAASAALLCFLNPDTIPRPGCLDKMVTRMNADPEAGAIGPSIYNSDGTLYPSCRVVPSLPVALGHAFFGLVWPNNPFTLRYQLGNWDHKSDRVVDWISGAAMLVRREAFVQAGGFDEGFFMYAEDVDLCDRLRSAGWKIVYQPEACMTHHAAGSTRRAPYRMIRHHHFSLIRYAYNKTKGSPRILGFPFVAAALLARMGLLWLKKAMGGR